MSDKIRPLSWIHLENSPTQIARRLGALGIEAPMRDEARDEEDRDPELPSDLESEAQARTYLHSLYLLGY